MWIYLSRNHKFIKIKDSKIGHPDFVEFVKIRYVKFSDVHCMMLLVGLEPPCYCELGYFLVGALFLQK